MGLSSSSELISVAINIGTSAGATVTMNNTDVRLLGGVTTPGAQISFSNFYNRPAGGQAEYGGSAGTFTFYPPAGVTKISGVVIGGGGGGGGGTSTALGGTGGGGGGLNYFINLQVVPSPLSTVGITVVVDQSAHDWYTVGFN